MSLAIEASHIRIGSCTDGRQFGTDGAEVQIGLEARPQTGKTLNIHSLLEGIEVFCRVDDKERVFRINLFIVLITQFLVNPAYALLQVILDDIQLALIGTWGKLL